MLEIVKTVGIPLDEMIKKYAKVRMRLTEISSTGDEEEFRATFVGKRRVSGRMVAYGKGIQEIHAKVTLYGSTIEVDSFNGRDPYSLKDLSDLHRIHSIDTRSPSKASFDDIIEESEWID
jgi:hypothetical protein